MATATVRYDPLDPAVLADPYDAYRELRDRDPVHRHDIPAGPSFVVLSRFADIWDAVRQPAAFSSGAGLTFWPDEIGRLGLAPTIVMLDPPRHTELRRLISRGWTQRRVLEMEDRLRAFVRDRLDEMAERAAAGETVDLHRELSSPLPTFVLSTLLAVPDEHADRFDAWTRALVQLQEGSSQPFEGTTDAAADHATTDHDPAAAEAMGAVAEMFGIFQELITARRARPGDDLISALIEAEVDGERLEDWDILGFCFVIIAGGNDTTGNLISHTVMLLDRAPDQRAALIADRELIPNALVECLRLESSVQGLCRTTMRPVSLHGTVIDEGTKVLMLYGSGNRDEREFGATADQLDIRRALPRHLGFSSGNHFCVGSHLALLQARVALEELLARHPDVGVDEARGERVLSSFTRGWSSLPATGLTPT